MASWTGRGHPPAAATRGRHESTERTLTESTRSHDHSSGTHVADDIDPVELFHLLDDRYARMILRETTREPMSAKVLSDVCDASLSTVYRRVDALQDQDLLAERTEPDPDGHHYTVYEANVSHVGIEIADGDLNVAVSTGDSGDDAVDQFTRTWTAIGGDGE